MAAASDNESKAMGGIKLKRESFQSIGPFGLHKFESAASRTESARVADGGAERKGDRESVRCSRRMAGGAATKGEPEASGVANGRLAARRGKASRKRPVPRTTAGGKGISA